MEEEAEKKERVQGQGADEADDLKLESNYMHANVEVFWRLQFHP